MEFVNQVIFVSAFLLMFCVFAGVASSRIGAPLLLTFLGVGILFGEDGPIGIIFNDMKTAYLVASLSLAVILFDGGLRTPSNVFRAAFKPALVLSTVGVVITAAITGAFASWIMGFSLTQGMLIGAVLASTDAAAVFLLLHQKGAELAGRVRAVLEVESGLNDPMAVLLTIGLVELLLMPGAHSAWWYIGFFTWQMWMGAVAGFFGGRIMVWGMNRANLTSGLSPVVVLSGSVLIFSGTLLLHASGFLAVYLAGLVMGNADFRFKEFTRRFYDGIAWLCQIVMFLMIGLLVTPTQLLPQLVPALLIALVLTLLARPVATVACLLPFKFNWREQTLIAWVGLRGAVPIFLALIPALAGLDHDRTYFNLAFVVVVLSLILQGWSVFFVARALKLEVIKSDNHMENINKDL